ncbi:hypothetical protein [Natrinema gelatinilyticum]|nr:hypothetical protein [Natrinema gelatinilyticum]
MSVTDSTDWAWVVESSVCEAWPLNQVTGDNSEPDWFDAHLVVTVDIRSE